MTDTETILARVRLGSYAGLFALIPMVFGFVLGSSLIPFVVFNTLFWLPILVLGVFERAILKVGPQGVVWMARREMPLWRSCVIRCEVCTG